jgi:hypothetical protein
MQESENLQWNKIPASAGMTKQSIRIIYKSIISNDNLFHSNKIFGDIIKENKYKK